jgi:exopolysaccharide biosynthesis protein
MSNGDCDEGFAVINGSITGSGGWHHPMFASSDGKWIIGTLNQTIVESMAVRWAIPGFYWLVRNGKNVAGNSTYQAPRTAIGVNKQGQLLLLEVDGCEPQSGCSVKYGKTDHDMAALLIEQGAEHALNLDGGGSSTTVENGSVINHPTDTDFWDVKKERAVTTITCVL